MQNVVSNHEVLEHWKTVECNENLCYEIFFNIKICLTKIFSILISYVHKFNFEWNLGSRYWNLNAYKTLETKKPLFGIPLVTDMKWISKNQIHTITVIHAFNTNFCRENGSHNLPMNWMLWNLSFQFQDPLCCMFSVPKLLLLLVCMEFLIEDQHIHTSKANKQ